MRTLRFCWVLIASTVLMLNASGAAVAQQALPARPAPTAQPQGAAPASANPSESPQPQQPVLPKAQTMPSNEPLDLENTLYLDLEYGRVVIKMHPEMAPKHVERIKELVRQGFYDGIVFHRVIEDFMAQTGDPKGNGTGGSGTRIPAEFNDGLHVRGAVSMARSTNINSADSQFFIVLGDSPFLDGQYSYWGEVVSGMEFVDRIRMGDPNENGTVPYPDRIVQMQVAADVKGSATKPVATKPVAAAPAKPASSTN